MPANGFSVMAAYFLPPDYGYIREFYPEKLDKRAFKCYIKLFDDIIIGILIRRVWRISVEEFFSAPPNREYSGQVFFLSAKAVEKGLNHSGIPVQFARRFAVCK